MRLLFSCLFDVQPQRGGNSTVRIWIDVEIRAPVATLTVEARLC